MFAFVFISNLPVIECIYTAQNMVSIWNNNQNSHDNKLFISEIGKQCGM